MQSGLSILPQGQYIAITRTRALYGVQALQFVVENSLWQSILVLLRSGQAWLQKNVVVLDNQGQWLTRWCCQFNGLSIQHLRSTSALHVDPHDPYAIVSYAEANGKAEDVQRLRHICRDRYFHGPFHTPSSALFEVSLLAALQGTLIVRCSCGKFVNLSHPLILCWRQASEIGRVYVPTGVS